MTSITPPNADYDTRTGRPLTNGRDSLEALSDGELEAELTIAAGDPHHRAKRFDAVLLELARRGRRQSSRA
jgi:hypothetical protein